MLLMYLMVAPILIMVLLLLNGVLIMDFINNLQPF